MNRTQTHLLVRVVDDHTEGACTQLKGHCQSVWMRMALTAYAHTQSHLSLSVWVIAGKINSLSTKHISLGQSENVLRTLSVHAQNSEGFVKSDVLLMTLSFDAKQPHRSLLFCVVADTLCTKLAKLRFPDGLLLMTL